MTRHDIAHRDAFESLAACKDRGGVDLVFTSPPYPDARTPGQYGAEFDTSDAGYHRLGRAVWDALRPGGVCVLNLDGPIRKWRGEEIGSERSLVSFRVAIDWAERIGFRYLEHVAYCRRPMPGDHGPRWSGGWEPTHVFARPGADPYFAKGAYQRPAVSTGREVGRGGSHRGKGGSSRSGSFIQGDTRTCLTAEVWELAGRIDKEHGAPFSREFSDAVVLCYSPPSGTVCDPFVGSGTVAISCHKHGRTFVGGDFGTRERDGRRWAEIVDERISQGDLFNGF